MTIMPGSGRLSPSRKWVHATHIMSGGVPQAIMSSTAPPSAATAGACPVASRIQRPSRQIALITRPRTAPWTMLTRQ